MAKKAAKKAPAKRPLRRQRKAKLLSGGNPQIAKGYGDAPVQAYIAADAGLEARCRPAPRRAHRARRARREESGEVEFAVLRRGGQGWFSSFSLHPYVKVTFFQRRVAASRRRRANRNIRTCATTTSTRDELDEKQFAAWVKQASKLPGEKM